MKRHPSTRQMRYAYGMMNFHKSKRQVALDAGFSESTARVPKSIENKAGFKLAMALLAGETANVAMKLMFELQVRDLGEMSNKELLQFLDVMSRAHERFGSKLDPISLS